MIPFLLGLLCALCVRTEAATFTVNKLTEDRAELSFSLEQYEIDSKETQTFHFAVSTRDDILCRGTIHSSANTSPRQLSIGERGWYGADYVQWFSFSLGSPNIPPAPEGTIIVETDKPVFSPTQAQAPITDVNGILYLPLRRPLRKKHAAEKQTSPFKTGLRMSIVQEGIYHISGRQLQQTGVPLSAVSPASLRLFNRGKELPLYVESHSDNNFDTDDYVSFYAKPLRDKHRHLDQYARAEAYWLVWELPGVALRVAELSGARRRQDLIVIDSTGGSRRLKAREFADTLHFEKDTDIRWLSSIYEVEQMSQSPHASDSVDNWYWGFIGDKELTEYSIDVPGPSRNQNHFARLRISLMGLSSNNSVADDHLLEVLLNDDQLGAAPQIATWDGQNPYIFESEPFPTAQLKEGTNRVIFRRPDRSFVDRSALNWIELEYMRDFKALDNTLFFRSSPRDTNDLFQFSLSGFDSPDVSVWDISHNRFFTQLESTKQHNLNSYTIAFQDSIIRPTRYIAVADHKRLLPESMTIDTISRNWHFPDVNYVMLTVDSLVPTLKPLADLHEKKGLRCEIVTIQDVYNSFSHGIQDPAGIQKMLQHVVSSQPTPSLKYLLLAGDATHDHYKQRQHLTLVPTHLSRVPGWGPAADDGFFATIIGNDNFPDLAVGRFPARDRHDLQIMVDKTINYILYPDHGYWRDNLLLAGGYEPDFTAFNDMAQSAILADRFNIIRMDADPQSPYYHNQNIAATTMSGHINAGVHFLNFAGHGGGNIWSDSRFFSYEDLPGLHNSQWGTSGRLPVIFSFTCLTGFFESVFYKSLGEEFVRNSADGAIAFYGASAYTRKEIDLQFNRIVLENLVHGSFKTLGDLIQHSELLALVKYRFQALPVIRQYNLLADPALPLRLAADSMDITLEKTILTGTDTLRITGSTAPVDTGTARVQIYASDNVWKDVLVPVSNGTFTYSYPLKESAKAAAGTVRACAWNESTDVVGWKRFSKDTLSIHNTTITPSYPAAGDTVSISCSIAVPDSVADPRIICLYTTAEKNARNLDFEQNPPVRMRKDSSGSWVNEQPIIIDDAAVDAYADVSLYVKFRILNIAGETATVSFQTQARPDLTFTDLSSTELFWVNDSLCVNYEVLNQGNGIAPPFELSLWRTDSIQDSVNSVMVADSLYPGKTVSHRFSLPDTTGIFSFSAHVNSPSVFVEKQHSNNTHRFTDTISYADIYTSADTLFSPGKGYAITGSDTLSQRYRAFLFSHPLTGTPLATPAQWIEVGADGAQAFSIATRPPLKPADSLLWHIQAAQSSGPARSGDSTSDVPGALFLFDTLSQTWCNKITVSHSNRWFRSAPTNLGGPFAYGATNDTTAPRIQALIGGREMPTVDYTPRNKAFTFIITDPSGIDQQSVSLHLNHDTLSSAYWNLTSDQQDKSSVTITALPPREQSVDSLTVTANDLAGNRARQTFAYLPGEKLAITFFSCHPNPFTARPGKKIRFAFVLTDIAEEVSISIFSIASRRIASFDLDPNRIGYQEFAWDGLTDNGYRIANGTYYAKITARNRRRKVKKIIRIVKLEGF